MGNVLPRSDPRAPSFLDVTCPEDRCECHEYRPEHAQRGPAGDPRPDLVRQDCQPGDAALVKRSPPDALLYDAPTPHPPAGGRLYETTEGRRLLLWNPSKRPRVGPPDRVPAACLDDPPVCSRCQRRPVDVPAAVAAAVCARCARPCCGHCLVRAPARCPVCGAPREAGPVPTRATLRAAAAGLDDPCRALRETSPFWSPFARPPADRLALEDALYATVEQRHAGVLVDDDVGPVRLGAPPARLELAWDPLPLRWTVALVVRRDSGPTDVPPRLSVGGWFADDAAAADPLRLRLPDLTPGSVVVVVWRQHLRTLAPPVPLVAHDAWVDGVRRRREAPDDDDDAGRGPGETPPPPRPCALDPEEPVRVVLEDGPCTLAALLRWDRALGDDEVRDLSATLRQWTGGTTGAVDVLLPWGLAWQLQPARDVAAAAPYDAAREARVLDREERWRAHLHPRPVGDPPDLARLAVVLEDDRALDALSSSRRRGAPRPGWPRLLHDRVWRNLHASPACRADLARLHRALRDRLVGLFQEWPTDTGHEVTDPESVRALETVYRAAERHRDALWSLEAEAWRVVWWFATAAGDRAERSWLGAMPFLVEEARRAWAQRLGLPSSGEGEPTAAALPPEVAAWYATLQRILDDVQETHALDPFDLEDLRWLLPGGGGGGAPSMAAAADLRHRLTRDGNGGREGLLGRCPPVSRNVILAQLRENGSPQEEAVVDAACRHVRRWLHLVVDPAAASPEPGPAAAAVVVPPGQLVQNVVRALWERPERFGAVPHRRLDAWRRAAGARQQRPPLRVVDEATGQALPGDTLPPLTAALLWPAVWQEAGATAGAPAAPDEGRFQRALERVRGLLFEGEDGRVGLGAGAAVALRMRPAGAPPAIDALVHHLAREAVPPRGEDPGPARAWPGRLHLELHRLTLDVRRRGASPTEADAAAEDALRWFVRLVSDLEIDRYWWAMLLATDRLADVALAGATAVRLPPAAAPSGPRERRLVRHGDAPPGWRRRGGQATPAERERGFDLRHPLEVDLRRVRFERVLQEYHAMLGEPPPPAVHRRR